ncbi:MAG: hypothetical protein MPJ50_11005 [Pirellulales bacterium]|nr:hypothetical protein [Pirellulales bacterium]
MKNKLLYNELTIAATHVTTTSITHKVIVQAFQAGMCGGALSRPAQAKRRMTRLAVLNDCPGGEVSVNRVFCVAMFDIVDVSVARKVIAN